MFVSISSLFHISNTLFKHDYMIVVVKRISRYLKRNTSFPANFFLYDINTVMELIP